MGASYFVEEHGKYRRQILLDEARRDQIASLCPRADLRVRAARLLVALAAALAPAVVSGARVGRELQAADFAPTYAAIAKS